MEEPCKVEHLEVRLEAWESWTVKEDGEPKSFLESESCYGYGDEIIEYACRNCGDYFTPEKRYDGDSLDKAWRAALDHLKIKVAA